MDQICKHALDEYPYECCGIVTGAGNDQTVHACRNIQNELHRDDPSRYPRDGRIAYSIERSEFDKVIQSAQGKGEDILAFYHSHPEHDAYFSEEDHAAQTVFGEPEFPDALQIVVSVKSSSVSDIQCYRWDSGAKIYLVDEDCF